MPSRWAQYAIVAFWLLMTSWLIRRDLLPFFGLGEVSYRQLIGDRAVEDPTHWILRVNERRIGTVVTDIAPQPDGGYVLSSRADLDYDILSKQASDLLRNTMMVRTELRVGGLGRLEQVHLSVRLDSAAETFSIKGIISGKEMRIRSSGLGDEKETTIPVDPQTVTLDVFNGIDRIAGLRKGKAWVTRIVNPLRGLVGAGSLLGGELPIEMIRHEVVGVETRQFDGRWHTCYVVEHRHGGSVGRTWVRQSDARVLRQEIPLLGMTITMEYDSITERFHEGKNSSHDQ